MSKFSHSSDIEEIIYRISNLAEAFSGKTVLLTGGRGFLGRYFMEVFDQINKNLIKNPVKLIVLDNLITAGKGGAEIPKLEHIKFIEHDVTQPFEYNDKLDFIIHAAGIASPYHYRNYPIETLEVAVIGTRNMLELAKKFGAHFIFFSSSEIYGDPSNNQIPIQENYRGNVSCQGPRACYDESKRVGETLCYIFHNQHDIKTNIIRPFNVYGPGMQETDYRVLPNFARKIKTGKPLHIFGDGTQTRTFCYITDALIGFFLVILNGVSGETYNIGNPEQEISMIDLAKTLTQVSEDDVRYILVDYPDSYPTDEPLRRCPNIQKARKQLGFEATVSLEDGLSKFLAWTNDVYLGE